MILVQETTTGYIWVHGRSQLAAAAGLVGSKAIAGQVGTIKFIHDKYWWGNRHNPLRAPCAYCSAHPPARSVTASAYAVPLTGIEHWGTDCADPSVVKIRKDSEALAREHIHELLGTNSPHLKCALFVLLCMLTQPYRFQGRFDRKSAEIMESELNQMQGSVTVLVQALTDCVRIFMEAGKDIYSLRNPGQALARDRQKATHKLAQAERQRKSSAALVVKTAAKLQRQIAGEAARLTEEQSADAPGSAVAPVRAAQQLMVNFLTPPNDADGNPLPRRTAIIGAARPGKPPRPPTRAGGKPRRPVDPGGARPSSGGIFNFLRELRPSSQDSYRGLGSAPPASPVPWSQDETANQAELYAHYTQAYSHPTHKALLARYRSHMGEYLKAMLERRCLSHISNHGNDKVTVPLDTPFGEVGFYSKGGKPLVPCLSGYGVIWGDVLHFLGYSLVQWTNLTLDVIKHCRPVLLARPLSARMDPEEYLEVQRTRNSSFTTKKLRARPPTSASYFDGNYFEDPVAPAASASDSSPTLPLASLCPVVVDPPPQVCAASRGELVRPTPLRPVAPVLSAATTTWVPRPHSAGLAVPAGPPRRVAGGLASVPGQSAFKRPPPDRSASPVLITSFYRAVEPTGLPAVGPSAGATGPCVLPQAASTRTSSHLSTASAPPAGRPLVVALGSAATPRQTAFKRPPLERTASSPSVSWYFPVTGSRERASAPSCEPVCQADSTSPLFLKTPEDA